MSNSNEMCGGFFCTHHEALLALYTTEESAIRYTCTYKFTARVKSRAYGRNAENEPVSRIKMADYCALLRKTPN